MNKKINLIPNELSVPSKVVRFAGVLNKASTIVLVLLVLIVITAISISLFFSYKLKAINGEVETLKSRVVDLQKSEQKLVLAKDRISKIVQIQKDKSAEEMVFKFKSLSDQLSLDQELGVSEVKIDKNEVEASFLTKNSQSVANVLSYLKKSDIYKNIVLSSFGFNTTSGYLMDFAFK